MAYSTWYHLLVSIHLVASFTFVIASRSSTAAISLYIVSLWAKTKMCVLKKSKVKKRLNMTSAPMYGMKG